MRALIKWMHTVFFSGKGNQKPESVGFSWEGKVFKDDPRGNFFTQKVTHTWNELSGTITFKTHLDIYMNRNFLEGYGKMWTNEIDLDGHLGWHERENEWKIDTKDCDSKFVVATKWSPNQQEATGSLWHNLKGYILVVSLMKNDFLSSRCLCWYFNKRKALIYLVFN